METQVVPAATWVMMESWMTGPPTDPSLMASAPPCPVLVSIESHLHLIRSETQGLGLLLQHLPLASALTMHASPIQQRPVEPCS